MSFITGDKNDTMNPTRSRHTFLAGRTAFAVLRGIGGLRGSRSGSGDSLNAT